MPRGCGDRWKVGLLYGCDLAWSEMREMQKGFSQEVRLRRDTGLFQWRRGQLGREGAGIRKEWDRRNGKQGVDGKVVIRGGPCCLVVPQKEGLGWREDSSSGRTKLPIP